jgi:ferredoxin/flavodoxin---NADP+ reductase
MAAIATERVTQVHHWNEHLFSFRTTRDPGFRFENGHFVMLGLEVGGKPLLRAYSIASPNWEEHLEFLSIKVSNGPLTSRLQNLAVGDEVLVSRKPTGTLVLHDLKPGRRLYLLGTGTGLAPFMSIIQDPDTYERFETVVIAHGVRRVSDLAYTDFITRDLPQHDFLGDMVRQQLVYHPTVTREPYVTQGRLTEQLASGALASLTKQPALDPSTDRFMLCGSPEMLRDCRTLLDARGFEVSARTGEPGDYVIERAFVDK